MRVLITGGAGFIGSHMARHWQERAEVVVLDDFRTGHRENLTGLRVRLVEGSITDRACVREAMRGVDLVFHLAAFVSVPESVRMPNECVEINVTGLLHVLEAAREEGVRKVVFSSSAAVYGEQEEAVLHEGLLPHPASPYAITKLDGELYASYFHREFGMETAALRFFNVFGPRQDPGGPYAAAVPIFLERALRGEPIRIFGDGEQTRDFIYVGDIVSALSHLAQSHGLTGVWNAGYGQSITIRELAERIIHLTGSNSPIQFIDPRPGDIRHSRSNPTKLAKSGWKAQFTLEQGLRETIACFRNANQKDTSKRPETP